MKIKPVFKRDGIQGIYRLFRITWTHGTPGQLQGGLVKTQGYSAKLSFALSKRIFLYEHESRHDYDVHFLFVRVHYCRSYAGTFT